MNQKLSIDQHPTCIRLRSFFQKYNKPIIVGIAGDSGSGKTTFSNGIRRILGKDIVTTVHMDGYHAEDRKMRANTGHLPLDPACNRLKLFAKHLAKIKRGEKTTIPIYDHTSGKFASPKTFNPSPVVIIEGLHTLYPQFLPFIDFSIYVDPTRAIKWEWKYRRDIKLRGHSRAKLKKEMLKREAAYKRWIDFQKINAAVVIKIAESKIDALARYELMTAPPRDCFKVELIIKAVKIKLPAIKLPLTLSSFFSKDCAPFLLGIIPSLYWGKETIVVHIDGTVPSSIIAALDKHLTLCSGTDVQATLPPDKIVTASQFAQALIAWRFLEGISRLI